ncbi:hypothetical protein KPH14_002064 [Odynerus spinipes]|uniref:Uncharacterized protein n=1 Tax=Odynerus spinipes TaxID=1348599 RepID=A0AAD9VLU5_9HYME|nr:hypothetical protein KPH14_002064 [Odynerus spinipes]
MNLLVVIGPLGIKDAVVCTTAKHIEIGMRTGEILSEEEMRIMSRQPVPGLDDLTTKKLNKFHWTHPKSDIPSDTVAKKNIISTS